MFFSVSMFTGILKKSSSYCLLYLVCFEFLSFIYE